MCVGDMSPYSVSGAKPKLPNVFLDIIVAYVFMLCERWISESRCYFFLSYAQKVGGMRTHRKLRLCLAAFFCY